MRQLGPILSLVFILLLLGGVLFMTVGRRMLVQHAVRGLPVEAQTYIADWRTKRWGEAERSEAGDYILLRGAVGGGIRSARSDRAARG